MNKNIKRFLPILSNGVRSVVTPLLSIGFSFVVVNYFSKQLWGEFVEYLLLFFIASSIYNWGNMTYLMRSFSQNPKNMIQEWQELFSVRALICLTFTIVVFLIYPLDNAFYLALWLMSAFVYNSFFSVIFYNRDYLKNIIVEIIGFLVLLSLIYYFKEQMSILLLIKVYAISITVKAITTIFLYLKFFQFQNIYFNLKVLRLSFPFFLLGISGFLYSKIDIYIYSFFYKGAALGEYQIISVLLVFSQSVATMLVFPYVKNIYRLPDKSILSLKKFIVIRGFFLNLIVISFFYFILILFFNIHLSLLQFCIAICIGFPSYIYSIHVFYLFRKKRENMVVKANIICLLLNLTVSLILLSLGLNITGILIGNLVVQLYCIYYYSKFKITT